MIFLKILEIAAQQVFERDLADRGVIQVADASSDLGSGFAFPKRDRRAAHRHIGKDKTVVLFQGPNRAAADNLFDKIPISLRDLFLQGKKILYFFQHLVRLLCLVILFAAERKDLARGALFELAFQIAPEQEQIRSDPVSAA